MIKNYSQLIRNNAILGFVLMTLTLFAFGKANAQQLSGTVTLNPTGTASATVFTNWYSFFRSLQGLSRTDGGPTMTAGISASVTLDVVGSNTTAEATALDLPVITNLDATRTLTINGNGNTLLSNISSAIIRFAGADYVTIKNLTIQNTNASGAGIWFSNQSDYNTVSNCKIYLSGITTANSSLYYIAMSTSVTSPTSNGTAATGTTGQPGSFNTFDGCTMYTQSGSPGPYYAVTMNGNSSNYTSTAQNNTLSNCTIQNFNYMGVYMYYPNGNIVSKNDISRANATAGGQTTLYGIYSYYPYCTGRSSEISGNNIHDLPFAGATLSTTNLSSIYGTYVYYAYGNNTYKFKMDGNTFKNIFYLTGSRYVNYVYYPQYIDITNNVIDNVDGTSTSSISYDWYVYYPTAYRCNGNTCTNSETQYYLYNFYIYYGSVGAYTWNEFNDNTITNNTTVYYLYAAYIYYYNGTNNIMANRNFVVNNKVTGTTGYFYFYLYYMYNYQVCNNVVADNQANSIYYYLYTGLSGSYNAEIRNNTFQWDKSVFCPTPGSSYNYMYCYFYYHTVQFTGNIFSLKGKTGTVPYYRYLYMYLSYSTPSGLTEFDYNVYNLDNNFSYPYWYFNGTNYTDWAGFSGAGVNGANDLGIDPKFIDAPNDDFRAGAFAVQNNVPYKPINIKDGKRVDRNKVRHDRGGLETNTDLQAVSTSFSVPSQVCAGYTTGTTTFTVKSLYPYDNVSNFNVSYSVNGKAKVSTKVTTSIAYNGTATITFPKELMLNDIGTNRITIFIDMPDDNTSNDTLVFTTNVKPAPGGGSYTFGTKPTVAFYQYGKPNDLTVLGAPVYYTVNAPRKYTNGTYGTDWKASTYAMTVGGNFRPASEAVMTSTPGSSDMEVMFQTTDASMEDSVIWMVTKISDLNNGCDTLIKRKILIYPTIVPDFTYPAKICNGDEVLFYNTSTVRSGSMEFEWDFGTGKAADKSTATNPVFTFPGPGTYKVKMTGKTLPYGFPSYDSATIVVTPIPTVNYTVQNACQGNAVKFTNLTSPASSYVWKFGDNTQSTLTSPTHSYTGTGGFDVSLTATSNGCSVTKHARAYVFDKPKAQFVKVAGTCSNDVFTFEDKSQTLSGLLGRKWNFDDNGAISTESMPTHKFSTGGTKNIKLISVSEFGCKDSITVATNVKYAPEVDFTSTEACSRKPSDFTNNTPTINGTNATYNWNFGDGTTSIQENPSHNWIGLGKKTVQLTVNLDNGCKATMSKDVSVGIQPVADFSANSVCSGKTVQFDNTTSSPVTTVDYTWDFGDGSGSSTDILPKHVYTTPATRTYVVTLKATVQGGCSDEVTRNVQIYENPATCDFDAETAYESGYYGMRFKAKNSNGQYGRQSNVQYTWVYGTEGSGTDTFHNFLNDGSYQITMRARIPGSGCECSKTKTVVMNRASVKNANGFKTAVFPNPAQNTVTVSTENAGMKQIMLVDATGKVVLKQDASGQLKEFDVRGLSQGVYSVVILTDKGTSTQMLAIQR